jgi:hypothetical protein
MSDSYRPQDIRALVDRVERIIAGATYADPQKVAVDCIVAVMNLPRDADGFHLQGFRADDVDDILLHLGAYEVLRWNTPGETVTGIYEGTRTIGWKYKTTYGSVYNNSHGSTVFTLPEGLREKLHRVPEGAKVAITYVGRETRRKAFTVGVQP